MNEQKKIEDVIKENFKKYIGLPNNERILKSIEYQIKQTAFNYSPKTKISDENMNTHSFLELYIEVGGASFFVGKMMCSKCEMIGEKENGAIYIDEDLNCNEYIMKQVIR